MTKRRRIRQAREHLARLAAPWIYEQAKNPPLVLDLTGTKLSQRDQIRAGRKVHMLMRQEVGDNYEAQRASIPWVRRGKP